MELFHYFILFSLNFVNLKILGDYFFHSFRFSQKTYVNLLGKINSIIHSIIIVSACLNYNSGKIEEYNFYDYLEVTKAYLIYDIFMMTFYYHHMVNYYQTLIHHILLLSALFMPSIKQYPEYVSQGLVAELTNIPLYFGWLLIQIDRKKSILFVINALLLLTLFLKFRVMNFIQLWLIALAEKLQIEAMFIFILALLNTYWFIKLLEKFFKTIII